MNIAMRDYDMIDALTLLKLTVDLPRHPSEYEGACICDVCHGLDTIMKRL